MSWCVYMCLIVDGCPTFCSTSWRLLFSCWNLYPKRLGCQSWWHLANERTSRAVQQLSPSHKKCHKHEAPVHVLPCGFKAPKMCFISIASCETSLSSPGWPFPQSQRFQCVCITEQAQLMSTGKLAIVGIWADAGPRLLSEIQQDIALAKEILDIAILGIETCHLWIISVS
jgi:hypothetical protein